jgi:hypothetical protein
VVQEFQRLSAVSLERTVAPSWSLQRSNGRTVRGVGYWGTIDEFDGIPLGRQVVVAGFNHNLQSSYGVTREAILEIGKWLNRMWEGL